MNEPRDHLFVGPAQPNTPEELAAVRERVEAMCPDDAELLLLMLGVAS
jgi:hypothetical protein